MRISILTAVLATSLWTAPQSQAGPIAFIRDLALLGPQMGYVCPKPKIHYWEGGSAIASLGSLPDCDAWNTVGSANYVFARRFATAGQFANTIQQICDGSQYNVTVEWLELRECDPPAPTACMDARFQNAS